MTIKECIEYAYRNDQLTEVDYASLTSLMDEYHEVYDRMEEYGTKFLIGEYAYIMIYNKVTSEFNFDKVEITSVAYDLENQCFKYNYIYDEDSCFKTKADLFEAYRNKMDMELRSKLSNAESIINKLGGDING